MRIKKLNLKNFRNYENESVNFSEGLNVLFGRNAQGKTNCAEAVFYLCTGTSPRCRRDKQLIRHGGDFAEISALAEGRYGDVEITARITENGREVRVNGNKITKNADILGNIYSVFFSPHELRLIQDGPDERRRFLNVSISQLSKPYYVALTRYNKILEQADSTVYISRNYYTNCILERNRFLVANATLLLAVYDERRKRSGTSSTLRYAQKLGRKIIIINPISLEITGLEQI